MLVLAGCGETSGDSGKRNRGADVQHNGSAATTTAQHAALWDPCAIPSSALDKTGLVSEKKDEGIAGVDFGDGGWEICGWPATANWYTMNIFSGAPTLDDVRGRDDYTGFTSRTVGNHAALQFRDVGASADLACSVAVELEQGVAIFRVLARPSVGAKEDPCGVLDRHVADLAQFLPQR
ncbi:hypothetical protein B0T36_09560 [Nocardia donostiensis]|nr:hypothetical protein B0T36_09560 [Nocardia donostiensis]